MVYIHNIPTYNIRSKIQVLVTLHTYFLLTKIWDFQFHVCHLLTSCLLVYIYILIMCIYYMLSCSINSPCLIYLLHKKFLMLKCWSRYILLFLCWNACIFHTYKSFSFYFIFIYYITLTKVVLWWNHRFINWCHLYFCVCIFLYFSCIKIFPNEYVYLNYFFCWGFENILAF